MPRERDNGHNSNRTVRSDVRNAIFTTLRHNRLPKHWRRSPLSYRDFYRGPSADVQSRLLPARTSSKESPTAGSECIASAAPPMAVAATTPATATPPPTSTSSTRGPGGADNVARRLRRWAPGSLERPSARRPRCAGRPRSRGRSDGDDAAVATGDGGVTSGRTSDGRSPRSRVGSAWGGTRNADADAMAAGHQKAKTQCYQGRNRIGGGRETGWPAPVEGRCRWWRPRRWCAHRGRASRSTLAGSGKRSRGAPAGGRLVDARLGGGGGTDAARQPQESR